jgi:DNA-binding transcriptional MerR regulator
MNNQHIQRLLFIKSLSRSDIPTSECEVILDRLIKHAPEHLDQLISTHQSLKSDLDKSLDLMRQAYEDKKFITLIEHERKMNKLKEEFNSVADSVLKGQA